MALDAIVACLSGHGTDWRTGGYTEGRPRLLSKADLTALMSAQVVRMQQGTAAAAKVAAAGPQPSTQRSVPGEAVSSGEALLLLMRANWDMVKAVQAALVPPAPSPQRPDGSAETKPMDVDGDAADPSAVGFAPVEAATASYEPVCGICFDPPEQGTSLRAMTCGHGYCDDCWAGTLAAGMERGRACIHDTCPEPSCDIKIHGDVWASALRFRPDAQQRLTSLALRSFVEFNSLLAYCPTDSCGRAAAHVQHGAPPEVVRCDCGAGYCVLCGEAPHWPLSCVWRRKWHELLNRSPDAEAIMQCTRPCPACGVRTQRSAGCMHISCTQCNTEWCWGCGLMGKKGEVHHAYNCTRRPDPTWSFEQEERKAVDGSLATYLDEHSYRTEQIDLLKESREEHSSPVGSCDQATACARGLAPSALCGSLLRALTVLRWLAVYRYYANQSGLPYRTRLAISRLTICTDELMHACGYGGGASDVPQPDWSFLASDAADAMHTWLVTSLLHISATLPPGPAQP